VWVIILKKNYNLLTAEAFIPPPPHIDSIKDVHGGKVSQKCKVNVAQMKYASPIIIAAYYKAANSPKNLNAE
jgi:hypothetical protein